MKLKIYPVKNWMQHLMICSNGWVTKTGGNMRRFLFYVIMLSFFISTQLVAQDSLLVRIISPMVGGTYGIEIKLLELQMELDAAKKQNNAKDTLLAVYANADFWYDTLFKQQKTYITEMESILRGYKELVNDYKKLDQPWMSFSAGIGASGPDTKPAVLFGLGLRRFRAWAIFQERNSGVLLGAEMPVF
jgi:hypothetical protein